MVQHFAYLPQRHVWFDRTKTLVTSQVFKEHAADLNVRTSSIRKCAQFIHESFLNSRPRGPVYSSRGWIRAKANAGAGGADRDRTGDPLLAKQVLSQLSYSPIDTRENRIWVRRPVVGLGGLEPPTSPLSGARSNHLSYRPSFSAGRCAAKCAPRG